MYSTIALLVGKAGTAEDMAVYDVASRIPGFVRGFLAGAQNVFLPAVTSLHANGQIEKIKAVVKKGAHVSSAVTCASLILLFVFTEEILVFWLKGVVRPGTVAVMRVLIISVIARGLFGIWFPSLVGMGHLRGLTIAAILAAVSAIVLVLILLQGFVPIPIPMAPAIVLVAVLWAHIGLWLPLYGLRKLGIRRCEYLKDSLYQPLIASIVAIAVLWVLGSILPKQSSHWLVMLVISAAVVVASFTAISLRKEAADLVVAARRRFEGRRQH
jgi:O-antigen/teichoic acid export membrane protein